MSLEPRVPPELERLIFEMAARTHPSSMLDLLLVARRVKEWLQPLSHSVVFCPTQYLEQEDLHKKTCGYPHVYISRSAPPELPPDLRSSARHLWLINASPEHTTLALSCPLLESAGPHAKQLLALPNPPPLKRLACNLRRLFDPVDFTHPIFAHLTHLDMWDFRFGREVDWSGLASIPNLTHLAFSAIQFLPLLPKVLHTCASLRVLLMLVAPHPEGTRLVADPDLAADPRFVWMRRGEYVEDWHFGVLTGVDFWSRAEDWVDQRRLGEGESQ
ncbi:hypothetical protein FB45DRAFT_1035133 [Roridomyces roridus]|uniref:Uncharacterized protein n=1 Tax=Roridomyces roridus TaxID=1738132 RepID=A0AAD7BBU1_9AGAR|nr:hypothetical protein FB45DRAFT_1035133 [Roridomyces roridus]